MSRCRDCCGAQDSMNIRSFGFLFFLVWFFSALSFADTMEDVDSAIKEAKTHEQSKKNEEKTVHWFQFTRSALDAAKNGDASALSAITCCGPTFTFIEIIVLPRDSSYYLRLQEDSAYAPSTWKNPNSMIAKAE